MVPKSLKRYSFAAAALLLLASTAHAVFVKSEMAVIDPEPLYDTKYFLNLLSYSYPLDWRWEWETNPSSTGYRVNAASLDRSDLFLEQELKLQRALTLPPPGLDFHYQLIQRGDKDLDALQQWLSLETGSWHGLSAGVFGEPTFSKEDADIGLIVRHTPIKPLLVYASAVAVDWNFNERGKSLQRYDAKPWTFETGATWTQGRDQWGLSAAFDTPLVRKDPSLGLAYGYQKTVLTTRWERPSLPGGRLPGFSASYTYEFKQESKTLTPDPLSANTDFHRNAHRLRGAAVMPVSKRDRVEAGAYVMMHRAAAKYFDSAAATHYKRWELAPYARWRRQLKDWMVGEAALFTSAGENRRRVSGNPAAGHADSITEAKLGLGLDFLFRGSGRIQLYPTFDLVRIAPHPWGGGNIRAQWVF